MSWFHHGLVSEGSMTLTAKVVLEVIPVTAWVAVTVMLVVPVAPAAGVVCTVRWSPLPPKAMFSLGTTSGLSETALRSHPVLPPVIVKGVHPVGVSMFVV